MKKTTRLSIYLIKKEFEENIFKESGLESIKIGNGDLYIGKSKTSPPKWRFFFNENSSLSSLINSYSSAVFIVKTDYRLFAIVFGGGKNMVNRNAIEDNFGFLTVLNLVDPNNLRSIDKKDMSGVSKNTREQISKNGQIIDFGINIDHDLIYGVTGKSSDSELGGMITGKDSLHISLKNNCDNIGEILGKYFKYYISEKYKENFPWIDNIKEVKDKDKIEYLNEKLISILMQEGVDEESKIWMAVPIIADWSNIAGFSFSARKNQELFSDLFISDFKKFTNNEKIKISDLKNRFKVYCFNGDMEIIEDSPWSLYSCIYCEIEKEFFLSNKKWYKINEKFIETIESNINEIKESDIDFIDYNYQVHNKRNGKKPVEGEYGYNKDLSKNLNYCLMDRKLIKYNGDKVEFCDVFGNDKIIHVKHYSGSSALSHLFNQGLVSGTLFRQEPSFRKDVNDILCENNKIADIENVKFSNFEIIFGIISHSKKNLDLPIFSKITLTNVYKLLTSFGYKVSFKKIYNNKKDPI
jgi:uncharacterized protein (TIGR04141 family)